MKKSITTILFAFAMPAMLLADNPPLMGWSSWNTYGFQINDSVIKVQADAMVSLGFKDCGYNHINIDDGFFGGRDAHGNLLIHPERFPNGLRPLVDYIHGKGLKAGIYSDAGRNTCASYWGNPKDTIGIGVGLYGHDAADFDLFFNPDKLNFDFIKIDYCGADAGNNAEGLDLDVEKRYKEIAAALNATGRTDITWNICRWAFPGTWACEIADSWRTTEDIYLGWESVKSIINQSLYLSAYTTYGHYNDMDMLEVGRGLTEEEDKTHFGMWCIMSSPLLIGCDMNDIKGNALELMQNKELIALNQNTLGLQAYVVKSQGGGHVLVKDVDEKYGTARAVAFYNPTNAALNMSIDFAQLDLVGDVKVRDLFAKSDVGVKNGSMSVTVPAHGTRIYRLDAEERLERTVYEAETAWLTAYQELKNYESQQTGAYIEDANCSGGVKVGWVGNRADNDVQWRNVYSKNGGEYTLRLYFKTGENRVVKFSVNGGEPVVRTVNAGNWSTVGTTDVAVNLEKGENVVRIYNDSGWMPDIDKLEVLCERTLKVYTENGSIDAPGNTALPLKVTLNKNFDVVLRPAPGYEAGELVVRHGKDVSAPRIVDGVEQWSEVVLPASSGTVTVDGKYVDGEVALYANFKKQKDAEWELVFSDEFNAADYSQPLDEKWMRCQRYGSTWNRWLSDSKEVIYLQGGDLVARALPNPDQATDPVPMITGGIKSNGRFGFTYGYVEARILSNSWTGHFPAFWMMPEDQRDGWPDCGEIDIWEAIDNQTTTYHTVHSNWTYDLGNKNNPKSSFTGNVPYDRYHTYGLMWDETSLVWYVDGKQVGRYEKSTVQSYLNQGQWPFDKHFHLILNQSVGNGSWAANADVNHTYETRFDWVRVYQKKGMKNTLGTVGIAAVSGNDIPVVEAVEGGVCVETSVPTEVLVYDLAGRTVAEAFADCICVVPLKSGIYLVCGQKVIVK
ncbi:MAG: family 16 glycosylhydrolase [Bacteroidaceae bacterium]|nr:family 16 glycosylhydrolase [Bacteroidaceae bacterium]